MTTENTISITHLQHKNCAGHGDHWALLTNNIAEDVPNWLQGMLENAAMPHGLHDDSSMTSQPHLLIAQNHDVHIKQILALVDGKPSQLINAFPCVNSPYGLTAKIERIITCKENLDTVLRLVGADGTVVYAFDQLYAVNHDKYEFNKNYYVNLSAWAYKIAPSDHEEVIVIEDQDAIRYHRAFNDIVAENGGKVPENIEELIKKWQPETDAPLAPVEINMGSMCAYLFGETLGQEDDAWCQGQVLGKQAFNFNGIELTLFDVVILREPNSKPLVVRIASQSTEDTAKIEVNDYIQASLWLQASIYAENQ
ncbi:MAG: hypothetical protein KGV51_07925 [Moraxellaceae bacterium]|nr:hypothetical protein [Moraxellaceae bacterium]